MTNRKMFLYKNLIGDAKSTIDAIQRYIEKNSPSTIQTTSSENRFEESVKRIIDSVADEETSMEINKIISRL